MVFDFESFLIAIDNCATFCMSNNCANFVGELVPIKRTVLGIGKSMVVMQGTLKWTFEDDEGKVHTFLLPGSLYTPDIPVRLLSPQHWAQHNRD
jgi:hypothetical protein